MTTSERRHVAHLCVATALDHHDDATPETIARVLAHLDAHLHQAFTDPEAAGQGLDGPARALWRAAFCFSGSRSEHLPRGGGGHQVPP